MYAHWKLTLSLRRVGAFDRSSSRAPLELLSLDHSARNTRASERASNRVWYPHVATYPTLRYIEHVFVAGLGSACCCCFLFSSLWSTRLEFTRGKEMIDRSYKGAVRDLSPLHLFLFLFTRFMFHLVAFHCVHLLTTYLSRFFRSLPGFALRTYKCVILATDNSFLPNPTRKYSKNYTF